MFGLSVAFFSLADILGAISWISLHYKSLHESCGYYAAAECSEETDERLGVEALADHEDDHQEAHAEGGAEVGEGYELVFLEIAAEMLVLCKRDYGRVVGEESHYGSEGCDSRKVEKGLHQRAEELLEKGDNAEFDEELAECSGDHTDCHKIEHCVQKKVVGRLHDGVQHVGGAHY